MCLVGNVGTAFLFFIRNNVFLYNVKAWRCVKRGGRIVLTPPRMLIWMKKRRGGN